MIHEDIVCPFCGCLCDDIKVTVEDGEITAIANGCAISRSKFLNHGLNRLEHPQVDGVDVPLEKAVEAAADILASSRRPLVYGLSSTECTAISEAVRLAELSGGVLDNTASVCHGPTILALQQVGESKATLGDIMNRADLVVFWGCNPTQAHIRHLMRYSGMKRGMYTPEGRKDRHIIAVDVRETTTARLADDFIKVQPGGDYELLEALQAAVRGHSIQADKVAGVPTMKIKEVAERMKTTKYGVVFFGLGLTQTTGRHMNIDAAVGLVAKLNTYTKFLLTPMRGHYNVSGANSVTTWQTGYPYAVDFSRGYPRYNPGEYTSVDMLSRGEPDAALIVASDPAATFPREAAVNLAGIPVITLDQKVTPTTMISRVAIPVATAGVEAEGTAYRMDGVPLKLSKLLEPDPGIVPDRVVLQMIAEKLEEMKQ